MTDKPTTLSLDSAEWRAMLGHNINTFGSFVGSAVNINATEVQQLHQHLDRMKALATAWHLSSPRPPAVEEHAVAEHLSKDGKFSPVVSPSATQPNGAAPKKGGWPKGKPRKRDAPGIAQVQ